MRGFSAALRMTMLCRQPEGDQVVQISMIPGPNFSIFSWPRPWMVFSCERVCGRARTMLRRVVEARTKKRGRFSLSDSALRHSRRRWSRACCSGVRVSTGSGVVERGRVKVSAVSSAVVALEEKCGGLSASAAKCALGRDDASWGAREKGTENVARRADDGAAEPMVASERQTEVISAP
jgi:hypothetical protein